LRLLSLVAVDLADNPPHVLDVLVRVTLIASSDFSTTCSSLLDISSPKLLDLF
jgi:hypothetical protein